ncbi:MAG: family 78 glycoside hydrolase catalytic domain [Clostridia bacterium]|nr:family 78 glycoside hydrolase catalytic domain [Clostridia bacterium]
MITDAKWIRCANAADGGALRFSRTLNFKKPIKRAVAHVSAMGIYELYINGEKVGDALFCPGFTALNERIQYQTYDITALLSDNAQISLLVGEGWALGRSGLSEWNINKVYADHVSVIAEIETEYTDGERERLITDESWDVYTSEILFSSFYDGETVDKTKESVFLGKAEADRSVRSKLTEQIGEYVKEHERISAKELIITPRGEKVIDFGQELAGYVEIKIKGERGQRIAISHAEVLDKNGNFYTENYRTAKNKVVYVLSGREDILKPHFSYQGFRYIRLDEFPMGDIELSRFTSVAVYSDMKRTGHFECGDERINKLYENIIWGQRSNFVDIPTDCPQRDERYGWTGDAQVFCKTASINYDTEKFFGKWLGDMALEQEDNGALRGIVPKIGNLVDGTGKISAGWGDAATIIPWEIYLAFGSKELLRANFPMMRCWVDYVRSFGKEEYLWLDGDHYGDWLAMDAGDGVYMGATQTDLIASAYFAHSTELLVKAGHALGEDVTEYEELLSNVRDKFRQTFMKDGLPCVYEGGKDAFSKDRPVKGLTQTALALILRFGLTEGNERERLTELLVKMIRENGNKMTTGFIGTPHVLHALSENGRADVAYDLLLQTENPSWLFSVNHGATTVWEHWDSIKADGGFWSADMNSFNHYAYGAVYDWIFGTAAGIKVLDDGAGYTHISIKPHTDIRLGNLRASIQTRMGKLESAWKYADGGVEYTITVPHGCLAEVELGDGKKVTLSAGEYEFHACENNVTKYT